MKAKKNTKLDDEAQREAGLCCTDLLGVVRDIRKSDCGAWLKPGTDGEAKRIELMKLLDKLYKVADEDATRVLLKSDGPAMPDTLSAARVVHEALRAVERKLNTRLTAKQEEQYQQAFESLRNALYHVTEAASL